MNDKEKVILADALQNMTQQEIESEAAFKQQVLLALTSVENRQLTQNQKSSIQEPMIEKS